MQSEHSKLYMYMYTYICNDYNYVWYYTGIYILYHCFPQRVVSWYSPPVNFEVYAEKHTSCTVPPTPLRPPLL